MSTPSFIGVLCKEGIIKFVYIAPINGKRKIDLSLGFR